LGGHFGFAVGAFRGAFDAINFPVWLEGEGGVQPRAVEMQASVVVQRVAGGNNSIGDGFLEMGTPRGIAVIMGGAGAGQKTEAFDRTGLAGGGGLRIVKPADAAGALPGQHRPAFPGRAEKNIETRRLPEGDEVAGIAAAHINNVGLFDPLDHVLGLPVKGQIRRAALHPGHHLVEPGDGTLAVSRGGRQKKNARIGFPARRKNVRNETRLVRLGRETAAERNDLSKNFRHVVKGKVKLNRCV